MKEKNDNSPFYGKKFFLIRKNKISFAKTFTIFDRITLQCVHIFMPQALFLRSFTRKDGWMGSWAGEGLKTQKWAFYHESTSYRWRKFLLCMKLSPWMSGEKNWIHHTISNLQVAFRLDSKSTVQGKILHGIGLWKYLSRHSKKIPEFWNVQYDKSMSKLV